MAILGQRLNIPFSLKDCIRMLERVMSVPTWLKSAKHRNIRRKADRRREYHLDAMEDIMMHYTGNRLVT